MRSRTPSELLTGPEVARIVGVDLKTVHNWANLRGLPHHRTPGRHLRFRRADVAEIVRGMGGTPPPDLLPIARAPLPDVVRAVFVAGPSAEIDRCETAILAVGDLPGVEVTYSWTSLVRRAAAGEAVPPDDEQAAACLEGIARADLVWLLVPSVGASTVGTWVEAGAAAILRRPIVASIQPDEEGRCRQIPPPYTSLVHTVWGDRAALGLIQELAAGASSASEVR